MKLTWHERTLSIAWNGSQIQVHMKKGKEKKMLKNLVLDGTKDRWNRAQTKLEVQTGYDSDEPRPKKVTINLGVLKGYE